ncbi:hypothetical protein A9Q99_10305 [Gammaproteobacteria bacterium 45_16_T64]|nr:hypothetical protein A9Q99_10305 [Gammaproteobacteria bacterium 45_16_T64]
MIQRILISIFLSVILTACKSTLTVEVEGAGSVVSDSGTISCPGTCSREILDIETITLTVDETNENYLFHHWEGACEGTDPICVLAASPIANFDVKAQFRYTGKTLGDIYFPDENLRACIFEQYPEYHETYLMSLLCDNRNIASIEGLEELKRVVFTLRLNDNQISDLSPLANLGVFKTITVFNNDIVDPLPLLGLDLLLVRSVDLTGNENVDCDLATQLRDIFIVAPVRKLVIAPQCDLPLEGDDLLLIDFVER